jgi:hypothetical protein
MQHPRDQQPSMPAASPLPPGATQVYSYYPSQQVARKPGFFKVTLRFLKLLLRRFLHLLVSLGRPLYPVAGWLIAIFALLGVISWMSFRIWGPQPNVPVDTRVSYIAPPAAVDEYIRGQQSYDADLIWNSFSPSYQAAQLQRGVTKENLQSRSNLERQRGLQFVSYEYVGGVDVGDGERAFHYMVKVQLGPNQAKLPLLLTVDQDGKIVRMMSPASELDL